MFIRSILLLLSTFFMASFVGAQQPAPPAVAVAEGYVLGVGDEVQVTLFGQQDMSVRTRITETGVINYPLLGSVQMAGRTAAQAAAAIRAGLRQGGYYTNPVVSVDVVTFVSNAVTLFGNLATPGVYPLDQPLTVAMAIARAGGAKPDAADYALLRRAGVAQEIRVDFTNLSDSTGINTRLRAGDTIAVPAAPQIFVYGQVNSPGVYPIRGRMTLRQALVRAGGPTLAGTERKVTLRRGGKVVKRVDLNQEAQAEDVLFVNERFF